MVTREDMEVQGSNCSFSSDRLDGFLGQRALWSCQEHHHEHRMVWQFSTVGDGPRPSFLVDLSVLAREQ